MILKPKTLPEMVEQLKKLPREKTRVIILVGRHPNEGTINLAVHHHEDWARHGAVTIRIPPAWTPHGFWHSQDLSSEDKNKVEEEVRKIPTDSEIITHLSENGFNVPIVNFHSTPLPTLSEQDLKLVFRAIPKGKATSLTLMFHPRTRLPKGPPMESFGTVYDGLDVPLNELLIEWKFHSRGANTQKAMQYVPLVHDIYSFRQDLSPYYLGAGKPRRESILQFKKEHGEKFLPLIKFLAENGLTDKSRTPWFFRPS